MSSIVFEIIQNWLLDLKRFPIILKRKKNLFITATDLLNP